MSQESYKEMLFSRQYVMAEQSSNNFSTLNTFRFDKFFLYVHPLLDVTFSETEHSKALLLGYAINPHVPSMTNQDVVDSICTQALSVEDVAKSLYPLSGRFALYIFIKGDLFVFHDACGYRTVVYTKTPNGMLFGSDEQIMQQHTPLTKGEKYEQFINSDLPTIFENFIPAGLSLFENVSKLIANHYLIVSTLTQKRFFPYKTLEVTDDIETVANKSIAILKGEFEALRLRGYKFAFTATAGRDSRLLMSFVNEFAEEVFYYTMSYWKVVGDHYDISVPRKILTQRGVEHHVFDCTQPSSDDFDTFYRNNTTMAHKEWGGIAYGMLKRYPTDLLNVKGVASEIACCYYYSVKGKLVNQGFVDSVEELVHYSHQEPMLTVPFTKNKLEEWFSETYELQVKYHYSPLDLFFWEQRMSSWQAQSQLEWDIVQESFTPFNNRELLSTILSLSKKHRIKQNNFLYKTIIHKQCPDLLIIPYDDEKSGLRLLLQLLNRGYKKLKQSIFK